MMRKINLKLIGVMAVFAFVFTLGAGLAHGQNTKTLTFPMPACPIKARTIPPTKTPFMLPSRNPLGATSSVMGTVQVADQTGGVIFKTTDVVQTDSAHLTFSRTVNTIAH